MPMLIGLCGQAQAGKDTVGRILVENHGFVRAAFADILRDMALALDPIVLNYDPVSHDEMVRLRILVNRDGWEVTKTIPEVRRTLQRLGTEAGRQCLHEDVWVDACFANKVQPALAAGQSVVITDVRFPNEIQRVQEYLGHVWRIDRPDLEDIPHSDHPSEWAWRNVDPDVIITNQGPVDSLADVVAEALAGWGGRWSMTKAA